MSELKLVIETERALGTLEAAKDVLGVLTSASWLPERFGAFEPLRGRFDPDHPESFLAAWAAANGGRMNTFHFETRRRYQATVMWWPPGEQLNSVHFTLRTEDGDNLAVERDLDFGLQLFDVVHGQYGHLCTREEYWSKNVTNSWVGRTGRPEGGRAHGTDRTKHLPGIYWANLFGPAYEAFFGEDRLHSAPAYSVRRSHGAWVLLTADSVYNWRAAATRQREQELREYLGPDAFFQFEHPEHPTRAPRFR